MSNITKKDQYNITCSHCGHEEPIIVQHGISVVHNRDEVSYAPYTGVAAGKVTMVTKLDADYWDKALAEAVRTGKPQS